MTYTDPKHADEYWSYCMANDAKCLRQVECRAAGKCLDNGPPPPQMTCQAYDYCPKRHNCMTASRCLDARAGPPRRREPLVYEPLVEVPEDRVVDLVNHPSHYNSHPSGIECIEVVRHLNFNRGNAIKYIWRAGEKSGEAGAQAAEIEDLKKARWYLDDEIKRLEAPDGKAES